MFARPAPSGAAVYRTGIGPAAGTGGGWPPARDCPVVVVSVYTYPGWSRAAKGTLAGGDVAALDELAGPAQAGAPHMHHPGRQAAGDVDDDLLRRGGRGGLRHHRPG